MVAAHATLFVDGSVSSLPWVPQGAAVFRLSELVMFRVRGLGFQGLGFEVYVSLCQAWAIGQVAFRIILAFNRVHI